MMSDDVNAPVLSADGKPLWVSLRKALRRQKIRALLLIAPLLLFVMFCFVIPIGSMLMRSVDNNVVYEVIPNTANALKNWDAKTGELPPEEVYKSFAADMQKATENRTNTLIGKRLNYDIAGISSKFRQLGRDVKKWNLETDGPFKDKFIAIDPYWGDAKNWGQIKAYSGSYTAGYFANAVDRNLSPDGIMKRNENERFYVKLFVTTFGMSLLITFLTFILGYPIAWLLANSKSSTANLLMIMVLLPFWTSLLVRTAAWKVSLQDSGVVNSILANIHEHIPFLFGGAPYGLMYNKLAVVIAMTHILLPFMILPMYSVMKTIPPSYLRAAKSLGATNWTAFWRVYFPQCIPGVGAGAILVFILAVGFYITPSLMGGAEGQFISSQIAHHVKDNQGLAAALGTILLVLVLFLYWLYDRIVGIDHMKLG